MKTIVFMVVLLVCLYGAYSVPIQGVCNYDGKQYKPGNYFRSLDGCNTCGCGETGMIFCTDRPCLKACPYRGQMFFPGHAFLADKCTECVCQSNGTAVCRTTTEYRDCGPATVS